MGGGPANTLSLLELVAQAGAAVRPVDWTRPYADWRPGDQRVFVADVRKARQHARLAAEGLADEGVDRLIGWVNENRGAVRGLRVCPVM